MARSSPVSSASTVPLHPALQQALANLDTQLEAELSRYRRQRSTAGRKSSQHRNASQSLELLPPQLASSPTSSFRTEPLLKPVVQPSASAPAAMPQSAPRAIENRQKFGRDSAIATVDASDALELSGQVASRNSPDSLAAATSPATVPPADDLAESEEAIEDYLESSEELLRSLAEEEAKVQAERGFMRSLLTPLGLGSMLLMLLSSAMFGYIVMNPGSVSRWLTARMATPESSSASSSLPNAPSSQGAIEAAPQPNLAAREFKDLGLDTLSTLKTSGSATRATNLPKATQPKGAPTPGSSTGDRPAAKIPVVEAPVLEPEASALTPIAPAAPPERSEPVPPEPQAQAISPVQPAPLEPEPAPAPPEPAPAAAVPRAESRSEAHPYKVVTPYTGDSSLDAVQKVAPDAFVNGSGEAQAGAFTNAADAEARAAELRQQGISAEVQKR